MKRGIAAGMILVAGILAHPGVSALEIDRVLTSRPLFVHYMDYGYDDWDQLDWYRSFTGFHATAGSISSTRFLMDMDARLETDIHPAIRFQYRYRIQESFLEDWETNMATLAVVAGDWYAGLSGMARSKKWESVIGGMTGFQRDGGHRVELRLLFPDLYYNSKGPADSEYLKKPVEYRLNGIWDGSCWTVCGEVVAGNRWEYQDMDSVTARRDSHARVMGEWRLSRSRICFDLYGIDYYHRSACLEDVVRVQEEVTVLRTRISVHHDLSARFRMQEQAEYVISSGDTIDPDRDPGDQIHGFHFERRDVITSLTASCRFTDNQWLRGGIVVGFTNLNAGDSGFYKDMSAEFSGKLMVAYTYIFGSTGQMTFGVSGDLRDMDFGGGNLRLSIYPQFEKLTDRRFME